MLNVFTSFAAVNEAVTGGNAILGNIPEYNFEGLDLVESIQECRNQIMAEAVGFDEFAVGADELIVESAMTNPASVEVLTESALTGIWDKLKSLLDKLISMVKGLIVKIKTFFAKFFGKTDSWCKLIEPKVKEARPDPDLEYTMWNWNEEYVGSGISAGAAKLFSAWNDAWAGKSFDALSAAAEDMYNKHRNDNEATDFDASKEFESILAAKRDDLADNLVKDMESAFGVTAASYNEATAAIVRKAHGDQDAKDAGVKIAGKMSAMFAYVKGSKDTIKKVEKAYKDNLTALTNFRNKLDKKATVKATGDPKNTSIAASIERELKTAIATVASYTTSYQNAINGACQLNVSLVQAIVKDYMNAVTKCVNSKGKAKK